MNETKVTLTDIDIPFFRLVMIFIKWGVAALPATIALAVLFSLFFSMFWGLLGFGAWHGPTTRL